MARFAPTQPDLFAQAPAPAEAPPPPSRPPLEEITELLSSLRAAQQLPWPDVSVAMAEEQHMLALARSAGDEGQALAASIMDEIERLFAAAEQEAAEASAAAEL